MKLKIGIAFLVFFLLVVVSLCFNGNWELTSLSIEDTRIFSSIRLPRTIVAALCGLALGVAGASTQGVFRNSLASPSILGTTSSAILAVVLVFYFLDPWTHPILLPISGLTGAALGTFLLLLLDSQGQKHTEKTLLVGFALTAVLGAVTSLILSVLLEDFSKASATMHWMLGGFSARSWEHIWMLLPLLMIGLFISSQDSRSMDILSLGQTSAESLSIDIQHLKRRSILAISLLVGGSVSVAGGIPFVGLIAPHLARRIYGPQNKTLVWTSALIGASITVAADLGARSIRYPIEMEVGVLTALVGAPFFLYLLGKRRHL